jgi:hypothetical protein
MKLFLYSMIGLGTSRTYTSLRLRIEKYLKFDQAKCALNLVQN